MICCQLSEGMREDILICEAKIPPGALTTGVLRRSTVDINVKREILMGTNSRELRCFPCFETLHSLITATKHAVEKDVWQSSLCSCELGDTL